MWRVTERPEPTRTKRERRANLQHASLVGHVLVVCGEAGDGDILGRLDLDSPELGVAHHKALGSVLTQHERTRQLKARCDVRPLDRDRLAH